MRAIPKTAKKTPPAKQSREQIVADTIEDAMRPYLGVLPPHALATMRDILEDTMATHPVALEALDVMDEPQPVDESGTRVREASRRQRRRRDGERLVSDESREQKLARRAIEAGVLQARALHWEKRYRGFVDAGGKLVSRGNAALPGIVEEYDEDDALGGFEDYCRRRLDFAMLHGGIRVEARHLRIDRAAQRAAADLLALRRTMAGAPGDEPGATPRENARALARAVAAATFVAMTEEAQRAGEEDMIAREEFATAMAVVAATVTALPKPQRRLLVLLYHEGQTLIEARAALGYHYNTVLGWHAKALAEIRRQLEKRGIEHAPGRGGAPRGGAPGAEARTRATKVRTTAAKATARTRTRAERESEP